MRGEGTLKNLKRNEINALKINVTEKSMRQNHYSRKTSQIIAALMNTEKKRILITTRKSKVSPLSLKNMLSKENWVPVSSVAF